MAVDRVRPHFEIDVGSGLILDIFGRHCSRLVTGVRANFAARVSQGGSYSAYAWRMRCEIHLSLTTSSLATCIRQSVYDSEVLSISQLRLWDICTHTLAEKGESISVAGACMSFGHARNSPEFDPALSRIKRRSAALDRYGKFDLALFQRLVQSSQLLAAHPRGPLRYLWLALL